MLLPRLLSASMLSLLCSAAMVAQTAGKPAPLAATPAPLAATPGPLAATPGPLAATPAPSTPDKNLQIATVDPGKVKLLELPSRNDGLCFAMRTSEFSAEDLKSSAPHASKHTTCTPATNLRMKSATVELVK